MQKVKIVFVGDAGCGKTSLLRKFIENRFDPRYDATMYDRREKVIMYKGGKYLLKMEDTAGQPEYARLRPLQYTDADVVAICFAVADNQYTHS